MALIKCPECNHEVSEYAISCPNCGYGIKDYLIAIEENETKELDNDEDDTEFDDIIDNNIECKEYNMYDDESDTTTNSIYAQLQTPRTRILIWILIAIIVIFLFNTCSLDKKCDFCGEREECDKYFVVYNDDVKVGSNGEWEIEGDYIYLSPDCYETFINNNADVFSCEKK